MGKSIVAFEAMERSMPLSQTGNLLRFCPLLRPASLLRFGNSLARLCAQGAPLSTLGCGRRLLRAVSGLGGCTVEGCQQSTRTLQPGYLGVNFGKDVFNRHETRIIQLVGDEKTGGGDFHELKGVT